MIRHDAPPSRWPLRPQRQPNYASHHVKSFHVPLASLPDRYQNGNVLDGEFEDGRIEGHAVFRYPNGDQREGFFSQNILDGQVSEGER